ncbi:MAG: hypothetical protein CMD08_00040 [Flavobacteriales bacterium]|nr:hypothetical protein [Flavobacteriales bacterium]|tara:strand:- start:245 stop:898 length:654 start_codon:yes stop_codon:yes gene_type:complete
MRRLLPFLFFATILSSCTILSDGNIGSSSASLHTNNFRYLKTVNGESHTLFILGIGGANDGLVKKAMNSLRTNLQDNQALTNITVDKHHTVLLFGLVIFKEIYVSADVVEFYQGSDKIQVEYQNRIDSKPELNLEGEPNLGVQEEMIIEPNRETVNKVVIDEIEYKVNDRIRYAKGTSRKDAVIQTIIKKGNKYRFEILIIEDNETKIVRPANLYPI